jgi:hypothetical protein
MIHRNRILLSIRKIITAGVVVIGLGSFNALAYADDQPYTEGPVVNVAGIRTEYDRFDDYMTFLAGNYKQQMEGLKKAGLILSYEVLTVEPRGADGSDIYLVVRYKNWAALDGLREKTDAMVKQVYGSLAQQTRVRSIAARCVAQLARRRCRY